MKEEIRNQIRSHMDRHKIMAQERDVEEMTNAVEKGTYAFNIIYLDIADPSFDSVLNSFSPLDAAKIVFRPGTEEISDAYSYDAGKRFQWFEKETLLIDVAKIREWKINQIIKQ